MAKKISISWFQNLGECLLLLEVGFLLTVVIFLETYLGVLVAEVGFLLT